MKRENIKVFLSPQEVWGPVLTAPTSALERSPIQVPAADLGCLTLVILGNWCLYSKFTVLYIDVAILHSLHTICHPGCNFSVALIVCMSIYHPDKKKFWKSHNSSHTLICHTDKKISVPITVRI